MKNLIAQARAFVQKLWAKEPARIISSVGSAVVFIVAKLGIVVPAQSITHAVAIAVPLLLGGQLIRGVVSPAKPAASTPAVPAAPKA